MTEEYMCNGDAIGTDTSFRTILIDFGFCLVCNKCYKYFCIHRWWNCFEWQLCFRMNTDQVHRKLIIVFTRFQIRRRTKESITGQESQKENYAFFHLWVLLFYKIFYDLLLRVVDLDWLRTDNEVKNWGLLACIQEKLDDKSYENEARFSHMFHRNFTVVFIVRLYLHLGAQVSIRIW